MSNRAKLFIPVTFFMVMLSLLLFGLGRDPSQVPSALINRALPEFNLPELFDSNTTMSKEDFVGNITVINVWATWCAPCHIEHPYLVEISGREKDITFVGVNYKDDGDDAREFLTEEGNPFKFNIVDLDGGLGIDLGVTGAPETFLLDATGTIRYRHVGVIDNRVWADTFAPLIAQIK
jgi:cytochrome c biogenesis protein CcmG, thiol:disulfide interchange protein DsbE